MIETGLRSLRPDSAEVSGMPPRPAQAAVQEGQPHRAPEDTGAARAVGLTARDRRASIREMLLAARSHGSPPDLGSLPLTVLTAAGRDPVWNSLQAEQAATSTASTHIVAEHGWHFLQQDNPDFVSAAIRDMLTKLRGTAAD